jgi:hypothetical protein
VEGGVREGVGVSVWAHLKGQTVLGDEEFVEKLQSALEGDEREQAGLKRLRRRPRWAEAVEVVERMKGEGWEQFRERRGDWGRDLVLWLGRKACGMKLKELAEAAGVRHYASVGTALRYLEHRSAKNPFLAQLMTQAKGKLEKNNK